MRSNKLLLKKILTVFIIFIVILAFVINSYASENIKLDYEINIFYGNYGDKNIYFLNNKGKVIYICDEENYLNIYYYIVEDGNKRYLLIQHGDANYEEIDINDGKIVDSFDSTSEKLKELNILEINTENEGSEENVNKKLEEEKTEYILEDYKLYKKDNIWWAKRNETNIQYDFDTCIGKDFTSLKEYKANGKKIYIFTYDNGEQRIKKQDFSNDIVLSNRQKILNYDLLEKGYIVLGTENASMGETFDFDFNKISNFGDDGRYHKCHIPCYELLTLEKFGKRYYYARASRGFVPGDDVLYDDNLDEIKSFYKEELILPYAANNFVTISFRNDEKELVVYDENLNEKERIEFTKYNEIMDFSKLFYNNENKQVKVNLLLCRLDVDTTNEDSYCKYDILDSNLNVIYTNILGIGRVFSNYFEYYLENEDGKTELGYMDFEGKKILIINVK